MSSEDERAAFIEEVIARARERWRGVVPADRLERHLEQARLLLFIHPVAMEYVARAMPRQPPAYTEERGRDELGRGAHNELGGKAVGDE